MTKEKLNKLSKDELIKQIKLLKRSKKFGLVWETETEEIVAESKNNFINLIEEKSLSINTNEDENTNFLIEGDNYHSLAALAFTHRNKVDIIYIDPPYNTGAEDWKYNNKYVGEDYRHSKWLSMMNSRLLLAKQVLKKDGVLICSIDKNEKNHLGVLLEDLFKGYEIHCITVVHNPGGVQGKNFSYNNEFAFFVFKPGKKINLQNREEKPDIRPLRDVSTGSHLRTDAKNCFYPIKIKDNKIISFGDVCKDSFHPESENIKNKDGSIDVYPIDASGEERKWTFARHKVESIRNELSVKFNKSRNIFDIERRKTHFTYKTVWNDKLFNANSYGTKLLREIIKVDFPFPKSLHLIKEFIKSIKGNEDALILDFFAGSGTTGHAVLEMNKEDSGKRRFILCTNNESNIARDIAYERLSKVINGYKQIRSRKDIAALGGNLKYFQTSLIPNQRTDKDKKLFMSNATDLICLKENSFEEVIVKKDQFSIYRSDYLHVVIIFDLLAYEEIVKSITKIDKPFHVYIFSLGNDDFQDEFEDLSQVKKVIPMPGSIIEIYNRILGKN